VASITIKATAVCAGGDHITFDVSGAAARTVVLTRQDLMEALTEEDLDAFIKGVAKLAKVGKTLAQWRTAMQTGVTVTA
jgi:hypothetical protein